MNEKQTKRAQTRKRIYYIREEDDDDDDDELICWVQKQQQTSKRALMRYSTPIRCSSCIYILACVCECVCICGVNVQVFAVMRCWFANLLINQSQKTKTRKRARTTTTTKREKKRTWTILFACFPIVCIFFSFFVLFSRETSCFFKCQARFWSELLN